MSFKNITRDQLYEKVWCQPMSHLAQEFGLSDRGLAKNCTKMRIPVPPRGYWARVQYGYSVVKKALPPPGPQCPTVFSYKELDQDKQATVQESYPFVKEVIEYESQAKNTLRVLIKTRKYHSLVRNTIDAIHRDPTSLHFDLKLHYPSGPNTLSLVCSKALLPRAARIMHTFVMALEARGHNITGDNGTTQVHCFDETIELTFREQVKQTFTMDKWGDRRRIYTPTGHLKVEILGRGDAAFKRHFKDYSKKPLEDQLNQIIVSLAYVAAQEKIARAEREEQERQYQLERQRQQQQQDNEEALQELYSAWLELDSLKKMLKDVKNSPYDFSVGALSKAEWLAWTHEYIQKKGRPFHGCPE